MGGSERNITQLLTHVDREQFHIHLAFLAGGNLSNEMKQKGFSLYPLSLGGIYTAKGMRNLLFLRNLVKEQDISLILTYHEASDIYGFLLSKICRVPVVTNRRDMGFKTRSRYALAYQLVGRQFNGVVSVCDAVQNAVIGYKWFPTVPMITIYNGIDANEYKPSSIKESNKPIVGIVANFRKIKGLDYFIEAASLVVKHQQDVQFIIIGEDHAGEKAELVALAAKRNIKENVHILDHAADISCTIAFFDVAVLSSLSEGFSNAILEYMAAEKPVVATDVGGNREAVVHGETGFLVPPKDANALFEAILVLLKDKEKSRQFGVAGRKHIEAKFSLEKMIHAYESLFHQFCKK